jgi:hypothetical protein
VVLSLQETSDRALNESATSVTQLHVGTLICALALRRVHLSFISCLILSVCSYKCMEYMYVLIWEVCNVGKVEEGYQIAFVSLCLFKLS